MDASRVVAPTAKTALAHWFARAFARWLPSVARVSPGRPFSLTLQMPDHQEVLSDAFGGDRFWRAPDRDESFNAIGTVAPFRIGQPDDWRGMRWIWARIGEDGPPPLAFFIAPPLGGPPRLAVPQLLLRRTGCDAWLTISGWRDATTVSAMAQIWRRLFGNLLEDAVPRPHFRPIARALAPNKEVWRVRVEDARSEIARGAFDKVVLARKCLLTFDAALDPFELARRLARGAQRGRIFAFPFDGGHIVAASPEIVAEKHASRLVSHALAGTAPGAAAAQPRT